MNMGVATFNLVSSLNLIIAQRLLRRLCDNCKQSQILPKSILQQEGFNLDESINLFMAVGCKHCYQGYRGRIGVFEILPVDTAITNLILQQNSLSDIVAAAQKSGMKTLRLAALDKVKQGVTSLVEVNRVIGYA